jgi:ATP-binding cassette subfamily B protein RaxB
MISGHYGLKLDLAELRERFGITLRGATLGQLMRTAENLGFNARPLRAELDYFPSLQLPCILHWNFSHFVVLKEVSKNSCVIHDPAMGMRRIGLSELSASFTGVVLELRPALGLVAPPAKKSISWRRFWGGISGLKRSVVQILCMAAGIELLALAAPLLLQLVSDRVILSGDKEFLLALAVLFLAVSLLQQIVGGLRSWAIVHLNANLNLHWLNRAFAHVLKLPLNFFERRHLGDVVSRFSSINTVQTTLSTSFIEAIIDGAMALVTLAVMLVYSGTLTALHLATVFIYLGLRAYLFTPLYQSSNEAASHSAQQYSYFIETIRGIRSIKLFNRMSERQNQWLDTYVGQLNAETRTKNLLIASKTAHGLLFGIERVLVIWLAALLVLDGRLTFGMMVAYLAFKEQFAARIVGLIDKVFELKVLGVQMARLSELLLAETEPRRADVGLSKLAAACNRRLELKNISFRYSSHDRFILEDCSASFGHGDHVAIVAPSGTGKSTLIKIVLQILQVSTGEIRVDGVDAQKINFEEYRDIFGVVLQDDDLFAGSIAKNIGFFAVDLDMAHVRECARLANIFDEIMSMPMGFHTLVGDMGSVLSGGQKQRILLARALYKRPQVLVLDEATSQLDRTNEDVVSAAIAGLKLTRIIIAHRRETVLRADRILRLTDGKLVELTKEQYLCP